MADVKITVNGRVYRLGCDDEAVSRFDELAEYVSATAAQIVAEFGQIGQDRILMMTCLRLADDLFDAQGPKADKPQTSTEATSKASAAPAAKVPASERAIAVEREA